MRESMGRLEALCTSSSTRDQEWQAQVEDTKWLYHIRNVLFAAWDVASKAHHQRSPVLVHCSHGWDRTSQVCSLAQLFLDPFYRTMDGFQVSCMVRLRATMRASVLIEKDWLAFGHPFQLRHAHGLSRGYNNAYSTGKDDQRSPIFLQFLDCVWQLVMQIPSYFEFNPRQVPRDIWK
ncbi:unnamed protein product [Choristocarpus tenellus]